MHTFTAFLFLEKKMKLEDWRKKIDSIDEEIVRLVNRRAKIAREIGVLKAAAGLPVVDAAREDEILRNVAAGSKGVLNRESVIRIFRGIIRESRNIQAETQVKATSGEQV